MQSNNESATTLWQKIEHVRVGMLTTIAADGTLVSRPMTSQKVDDDGVLWFFASAEAAVAHQIEHNPVVNVGFAAPDDSVYVSVSGTAEVVLDKMMIASMWSPLVSVWFAGGADNPHIALIKVKVHAAEYWDSDQSKMMQLYAMAKAAVTGEPPAAIGEYRKFNL